MIEIKKTNWRDCKEIGLEKMGSVSAGDSSRSGERDGDHPKE